MPSQCGATPCHSVALCHAAMLSLPLPLPCSARLRFAVALFFFALQGYALATLCDAVPFRCNADRFRALAHLQSALSAVQRVANAAFLHGTDSNRPRSAVRHALAYPASAVSKIAAVKHTVAVSAVAATPSVPLSLSPAVVSSPNHAAVAAVSKSRFISCSSVFTRTTLERSERVILFFLSCFLAFLLSSIVVSCLLAAC